MRQFHSLKIKSIQRETRDSVRIGLRVPDDVQEEFKFLPGQHLPFQLELDGKKLRRTYSICSGPGEDLEIGVRVQPGGRFSEYAANVLSTGDTDRRHAAVGPVHLALDRNTRKTMSALRPAAALRQFSR